MRTPIAFDEEKVERFWPEEEWDQLLPPPGFVTDFVLATRGLSTPTKFCLWSALFLVSTVLKRDAELYWEPLRFFPNLYVFLVGPPNFTGKSTIIDNYVDQYLLRSYHKHIKDPILRRRKRVDHIITGSCTPQAMIAKLRSVTVHERDANRILREIKIGSKLCIATGELATFLGKEQYNSGLIQKLTSLFDCKAFDTGDTLSRGTDKMEDIYVTILGGITKKGFEDSLPSEALDEGFLSRVIIVSQETPTRPYSHPVPVIGGPTIKELQKRLAWIAENGQGVYQMTDATKAAYDRWYKQFIKDYNRGVIPRAGERFGKHLLRLAMLIRIQRYEKGNEITIEDYRAAERIIEALKTDMENTTTSLGCGAGMKNLQVVRTYVRNRGTTGWKQLQKAMSTRGILSDQIKMALRELVSGGEIEIRLDGKARSYPGNVNEDYVWKGEER